MKIRVIKHTGKYDTKRRANAETGKQESYKVERTEDTDAVEIADDHKGRRKEHAARLRAELLTRDTGLKHSVKVER